MALDTVTHWHTRQWGRERERERQRKRKEGEEGGRVQAQEETSQVTADDDEAGGINISARE